MPELPDIEAYLEALRPRVLDRPLSRVTIRGPLFLRTVDPPVGSVEGRRVVGLRRLGKRIVMVMEGDLFLVLHLMIAGRLRWKDAAAKPTGRIDLAAFDFDSGTLIVTEASPKKRASLHVVAGEAALAAHDPGGIEPLECDVAAFATALRRENHTIKRALTDPRLIAGIGNAYSDEILHAARLSPVKWTSRLTEDEIARLHEAVVRVLTHWTDLLTARFATRFPGAGDITAFRPEFAVHGKYDQPCPVCATHVQRIRYADNETNYCPRCQTKGKVLADRSLSRLLKGDWPRTIEELEQPPT